MITFYCPSLLILSFVSFLGLFLLIDFPSSLWVSLPASLHAWPFFIGWQTLLTLHHWALEIFADLWIFANVVLDTLSYLWTVWLFWGLLLNPVSLQPMADWPACRQYASGCFTWSRVSYRVSTVLQAGAPSPRCPVWAPRFVFSSTLVLSHDWGCPPHTCAGQLSVEDLRETWQISRLFSLYSSLLSSVGEKSIHCSFNKHLACIMCQVLC